MKINFDSSLTTGALGLKFSTWFSTGNTVVGWIYKTVKIFRAKIWFKNHFFAEKTFFSSIYNAPPCLLFGSAELEKTKSTKIL